MARAFHASRASRGRAVGGDSRSRGAARLRSRDLADGQRPRRLHGRPLQRGHRRAGRRHAPAAASDREPDALPAAARARPAQDRRQDRVHGARLRRHASQGVPVRPPLPRAARRLARRRRAAGRARLPVPAGRLHFELDPVAREIVLAQHPRRDPEHVARAVRRASLARRRRASASTSRAAASSSRTSTPATTAGRRCAARRACRRPQPGPTRASLLRASAGCCTSTTTNVSRPTRDSWRATTRPIARHASSRANGACSACSSRRSRRLTASASFDDAVAQLWAHPQVRAELVEVLDVAAATRVPYLDHPLGLPGRPACTCTRATRASRSSRRSASATARSRRRGRPASGGSRSSQTDLFAFTLDKSVGGFSPTTRYRDYAISPELIHWESQSATAADSATGRRYINQRERGHERRAVRPAADDRPRLLVPRPGDVREPRGRATDRVRLEARPALAGRALHGVRRRRRRSQGAVAEGCGLLSVDDRLADAPARRGRRPIFIEPRWPIALVVGAYIAMTITLRVDGAGSAAVSGPSGSCRRSRSCFLVALVLADPNHITARARWLRRVGIALTLRAARRHAHLDRSC